MTVLIVEDDQSLAKLIEKKVTEEGYETCCLNCGAETIDWLGTHSPYMMILDYYLPDKTAPELISALLTKNQPLPPFIIITGQGDEQIAVNMMKLGACDYLVKDSFLFDRLPAVLQRAAREIEKEKEHKQVNEMLKFQLQFEKMVAKISSTFITLSSSSLDQGINRALEATGILFNADRSYVLNFNDKITHFDVTHEWCRDGIFPTKERNQNFPVADNPWWVGKLLSKPYVFIEDVDKMPPEAAKDKEDLKVEAIKTFLAIPLKIDSKVIGAFGYETVKRKAILPDNHINLLTVVAGIIASAINRHQNEVKIRYMSFHDYLTGLYNRHYLEAEISKLNIENHQLPISIIMADLNGLKLINDTYGQDLGDELIKRAAAVIKKVCRTEDIIARYGGDEFLILMPQVSEKQALPIMKRIATGFNLEEPEEIPLSITCGVATKTRPSQELRTVIRNAENNMYRSKLTESRSGKSSVVNALLRTLAEKSDETEAHTRNMQEFAVKIGAKIGLPESELQRLRLLITLHDIGKINLPENILTKQGALTSDEWNLMKKHSEIGYRIARATEEFSHVADDILSHHERWDGSGYPRGLKMDEIPLLARITTVADAYEVMCNGRPYKEPMTPGAIIAEFKRCSGSQFDPTLTGILIEIIETSS